jgi:hypothetical protein
MKNLELEEKFMVSKSYKKQLWKLVQAYNISMAVLDEEIPEADEKNRIWKKFFAEGLSINSREYRKLQEIMSECMTKINEAVLMIDKTIIEGGYEYGNIYKITDYLSPIGVLAFEFPK